jgi:hypothetical protein
MEMDWARARRRAGNDSMARLLVDNEGNMAADVSRPVQTSADGRREQRKVKSKLAISKSERRGGYHRKQRARDM